jgi:hypothetical protein
MANGFPASVVSQLMSEFKVPECHQMAASRHSEGQFFDARCALVLGAPLLPSTLFF